MPAYYDEKQKTWFVRFRYKDFTGTTRSTTKRGFKRKKDALAYERSKIDSESAETLPFSVLVERYLESHKQRTRRDTHVFTESQIKYHILPFFGKLRYNEITTRTVIDWREKYLSTLNLADTTLFQLNGRLSAIFNFACKYYGTNTNPVRNAGSFGSLKRKKQYGIWTVEQAEKFCHFMESKAKWKGLLFRTLFYTGLRPCELLALKKEDIEGNVIHVSKSFHGGMHENYTTEPKNSYSIRDVVMPAFLADAMHEHITSMVMAGAGDERIFPTEQSNIRQMLSRYSKKIGLDPIRTYDLRHSHASMLIAGKQDINGIAARMGHASPHTTLTVYSHLYKDKAKELVDFLECSQTVVK